MRFNLGAEHLLFASLPMALIGTLVYRKSRHWLVRILILLLDSAWVLLLLYYLIAFDRYEHTLNWFWLMWLGFSAAPIVYAIANGIRNHLTRRCS